MLILASQSPTRKRLLNQAGVSFETLSATIDERETEKSLPSQNPSDVALHLAQTKAQAISRNHPKAYVIGADQLLTCNGKRYHKPASSEAAREQMIALRGQTHELNTAICVIQNNQCLMSYVAVPKLTMRAFSDSFLQRYIDAQSPDVLLSPGSYRYEEYGIQLFDQVEGDMHSILGLPMLPLLAFLRSKDLLPS